MIKVREEKKTKTKKNEKRAQNKVEDGELRA